MLNIPSNCIALDRSQCPITNCSSLLSTVRFASFRAIRATSNLSLTMKATNMCWTFPAIVLSFIVLGVVPQIVQGHFPVWLTSQQFHYILSSSVSYHNGSRLLPTVSCAPIAATVGSPVGPMCYLIMLVLNIQPHVLDRIWQCLFWISSLMY